MIVSNIGITPDFSAIYTSNSGPNTAFVQVSLKEDHKLGSLRLHGPRARASSPTNCRRSATYFQTGGLVDAVVNQGLPAPIDIQVQRPTICNAATTLAPNMPRRVRQLPRRERRADSAGPRLSGAATRHRPRARQLDSGLIAKEVVDNVITALTSNGMIAPSYWIDPKTGNNYLLTVQYPRKEIQTIGDLERIPLRAAESPAPTPPGFRGAYPPHQHAHGSGPLSVASVD